MLHKTFILNPTNKHQLFQKCANDIYATCTDQGKNMTKATDILQNAQNQIKVKLEINETNL